MVEQRRRWQWKWLGPLMLCLAVAMLATGFVGSLVAAPVEAWNGRRTAPASATEVVFGWMIGVGFFVALAALFVMLFQSILWLVRKVGAGQSDR